jgi:hypothetical protein
MPNPKARLCALLTARRGAHWDVCSGLFQTLANKTIILFIIAPTKIISIELSPEVLT